MEYKVRITLTEIYETYIEADSEEEAEAMARKQLNNGELDLIADTMDYEVEEVDA